jgi:hypothetical protein
MADEGSNQESAGAKPEGEKKPATEPAPNAAGDKAALSAPKDAGEKAATPAQPKAKRAPAEPPTEEQINSPDVKTLVLLFAIFAVTASSWGAARFSCNMHPPESKPPPKLTTDRLAANPKDAAIEFIQRARSNDYEGALVLALRDARTDLEAARAQCQKTPADCARKKEAMAGLLTTAVVERQDVAAAEALATTYFKGEKKTFRVRLVRDGSVWKAVAYNAE